jgi:hypothetical protein
MFDIKKRGGCRPPQGASMAWLNDLNGAMRETAARRADPLRARVERLMRGQTAMSTAALLDLLGLPHTTANGRLLAKTMRSLGFIPLKSRRLLPGGHEGVVTRGWMRPLKPARSAERETVEGSDPQARPTEF